MHLALFVVSSLAALTVLSAQQLPGIDAAMQAQVDTREVAGAVTLVATKDKVVHLEATGFSDLDEKRSMATDALFWIASCSKPFAAVAILMCQDDGKLSLSDPVANFIPAFAELKTPLGRPANLTIEQLLTHTSGLADFSQTEFHATKSLADAADLVVRKPMQFEPGERWKYTTSPFSVAGRIVEIVSGKTYDTFLQERLLSPLGMKDTTFYPNQTQLARLAGTYAKNRGTGALVQQPNPMGAPLRRQFAPVPGGGLFSTAGDLGRFGQMLLGEGVLDGRRYLSETAYRALTTVRTGDLPTGFSAAQINRVLGWGLGTYVLRTPHVGVSATLSVGSFGHPGACGTHLIVDPMKALVYVLMVQRPNLTDNFENETCHAFLQAAADALDRNKR